MILRLRQDFGYLSIRYPNHPDVDYYPYRRPASELFSKQGTYLCPQPLPVSLRLQIQDTIFRRPPRKVSYPKHSYFFRCAAFITTTKPQTRNSIFGRPPSDAAGAPAEIFLPAARGNSSTLNPPFRQFDISRSRERGYECHGTRIFFLPLRGANFNPATSDKIFKSPTRVIFFLRCAAQYVRALRSLLPSSNLTIPSQVQIFASAARRCRELQFLSRFFACSSFQLVCRGGFAECRLVKI
ncbi:hypothetical protein R3P38DRAFT_2908387 [Favolaschia claudopus]|uniref:Uncharacterized protein n=1 Tax=Favolaschia claudopus TaxID=2862362 RepID=A0AAW0C9X9_9AGAR